MLSPLPGRLDDELAIIAMTRSLKPLAPDFLQYRAARELAYVNAGFRAEQFNSFDTKALGRETTRREIERKRVFRAITERMAS